MNSDLTFITNTTFSQAPVYKDVANTPGGWRIRRK